MHRYIPGACTDASFITPFPAGCGIQHWFVAPVRGHWITADPPSVLSPEMSSTNPFRRLWIIQPLPCFTNSQRWLNLLVVRYWMMRVSGSNEEDGTSRALPELVLMRMQLFSRQSLSLMGMKRNIWEGSLGLKARYLRTPSRLTALSPSQSSLIQQKSSLMRSILKS